MTTGVRSQSETVRRAYDRIAMDYDQQVDGDAWMRRILWRHYLEAFKPGDHVLDAMCGTGIDAVFLAQSGIRVTAVDISPSMIEQLCERSAREGFIGNIQAMVLDVSDISTLPDASFDGIISAFAGLNTIPDLHAFARDAESLLRPGGRMILHALNRFSLWEWLTLVVHGNWHAARQLGRSSERDFTIGGVGVQHYMHAPMDIYANVFADSFTLQRAYSLGSLRPPHTVRAIPHSISTGLGALELRLGGRRPLLNMGRFFVLSLVRRPADGHAG